jgi:predicted esterase
LEETRTHRRVPGRAAWIVLAAIATGALGAVIIERCRLPRESAADAHAAPGNAPLPVEPLADWCPPAYEAIHGGCLALPDAPDPSRPLVVYLHGRYERDAPAEEADRQTRLARDATERRFAVLALRGKLGECSARELAGWYCWPSNQQNGGDAESMVERWRTPLEEAQRRARAKKSVVLGFSSGGYFAALLACRGFLDAEAFVIAHGGPVEPVQAERGRPPMLLLSADDDVAQDDMLALDAALTRLQWAHDAYARDGAHGLTDGDIATSLTFFERSHEPLPLDPPLARHRPSHHPHDLPSTQL